MAIGQPVQQTRDLDGEVVVARRWLGNQGFGEGNFRALFESIELDQIRRGVIKVDA